MKKDYDESASTLNKYGEWVPMIPEPYYHVVKVDCNCGASFYGWDMVEKYRGHYALVHILGL